MKESMRGKRAGKSLTVRKRDFASRRVVGDRYDDEACSAQGFGVTPASCGEVEDGASGGLLYATFGSTRDTRFGQGKRIDDSTFAPTQGDERGVAHAYFDRERLLSILDRYFIVESLSEECVDDVAGTWAHRERPLDGAAHWFAIARKR